MVLSKLLEESTTSFKTHGEINGEKVDTSELLLVMIMTGTIMVTYASNNIHITQYFTEL